MKKNTNFVNHAYLYLVVIKPNFTDFPEEDRIYVCDTVEEANDILKASYDADMKELAGWVKLDEEVTYLDKYDGTYDGRITLNNEAWYSYTITHPDNLEFNIQQRLNEINC